MRVGVGVRRSYNYQETINRGPTFHPTYCNENMSGFKNFAIAGAGLTGRFIVRQFLKEKSAGTVNEVVVLTREVRLPAVFVSFYVSRRSHHLRQGSKTTIDGEAKVIPVDYANKESLKSALTGIDVVISTIGATGFGLQVGIAEAAKEVGVKLFVPSEFGGPTEGETEGVFGAKAKVHDQLKALGLPYVLFYTGPYADNVWNPCVSCFCPFAVRSIGSNAGVLGTSTSTSKAEKYPLAAMATSRFRSPPGPTSPNTFLMF
jgi:NmrA-like family